MQFRAAQSGLVQGHYTESQPVLDTIKRPMNVRAGKTSPEISLKASARQAASGLLVNRFEH